jgi:hypothetical protein
MVGGTLVVLAGELTLSSRISGNYAVLCLTGLAFGILERGCVPLSLI